MEMNVDNSYYIHTCLGMVGDTDCMQEFLTPDFLDLARIISQKN